MPGVEKRKLRLEIDDEKIGSSLENGCLDGGWDLGYLWSAMSGSECRRNIQGRGLDDGRRRAFSHRRANCHGYNPAPSVLKCRFKLLYAQLWAHFVSVRKINLHYASAWS